MTKGKGEPERQKRRKLRLQAEEVMSRKAEEEEQLTPADSANLVHELGVHQIELDLQNEELRRAQAELQQSLNRYLDLFDFAPVGYFTLNKDSVILEANVTAATLLGVEKGRLGRRKFSGFIAPESQDAFHFCVQKVLEGITSQQCELEMVRRDGTRFFAELRGLAVSDGGGEERYRLAATDVTERKKAEEQIRRQARMLDLVGEAGIAADTGGSIVYWNDAAQKMYGWQRDEVLGHNAIDIIIPEVSRGQAEEILAKLRNGGSWYGEFLVKRKDGTVFPSLFNVTPLLDEKGELAGLIGAGRDITQRKRMEESIRASQASLAEAQRIANMGSWEWHVRTGRMRWSPHLYRILGLDSRTFVPTFGAILNVVHPDDRELFAQTANDALTQNKPYDIEFRIVQPGGSVRSLHFVAEVKSDETGKPLKLVGTAQDITERKQAEEERKRLVTQLEELTQSLANEKGILDAIMRHTGVMLVYFDPQFNFVKINQAYAQGSGHPVEELIGKNHFDLFPDRENRAIFEQVRDTGKPVTFHDKPLVFADQPERGVTYWDWTLMPVKDSSGKVQGLVLSLLETTARVQAEEQMRIYERLATVGKVAGSISHELRNPLGVIDSSTFYLQRRLKKSGGSLEESGEKAQVHLERIHSSVVRSAAIIQNLLSLTQMKELQVRTVDLRTVTSGIISEIKIPATAKVIEDFSEQEVMVNADRELLRMAFENIISNAVQAMEESGTLTVAVRSDGKEAELSFSDTGPGISGKNMDRVFQPLFSTKSKGIGLGLAITRMIVERHGGTIRAKSTQGKGATFIIRLPLADGK